MLQRIVDSMIETSALHNEVSKRQETLMEVVKINCNQALDSICDELEVLNREEFKKYVCGSALQFVTKEIADGRMMSNDPKIDDEDRDTFIKLIQGEDTNIVIHLESLGTSKDVENNG